MRSLNEPEQDVAEVSTITERAHSEVRRIFQLLETAHWHWKNVDGREGYARFQDHRPPIDLAMLEFQRGAMCRPGDDECLVRETCEMYQRVLHWAAGFPQLRPFGESRGIMRGGNIPEHRCYGTQEMLNSLRDLGAEFARQSTSDEAHCEFKNLFVTSLSYPCGGKMRPHSGHTKGRECDLWTRRLDQRKPWFEVKRTTDIIATLLRFGVAQVIYSHPRVIDEANRGVPGNPRAVWGGGHEDHVHFEL